LVPGKEQYNILLLEIEKHIFNISYFIHVFPKTLFYFITSISTLFLKRGIEKKKAGNNKTATIKEGRQTKVLQGKIELKPTKTYQ